MTRLSRAILLFASSVVAASVALVGLQFPYIFGLLLIAASARRAKAWRNSYAHGSARIASLFDLMSARMLGQTGLILGRASGTEPPTRWQALLCLLSPAVSSPLACRIFLSALWRRSSNTFIRLRSYTHLLTCAPSGAGKSTDVLVPNLRSYRGSCVVIDPKGELHRLTSSIRERKFGHRIVRIDPLGVAGPAETSDGLNPFDFINEQSAGFIDECRSLVELLVTRPGTEPPDPHWNERASDILVAFCAFVCAVEADVSRRNLSVVRDLVSSRHTYKEALETMQKIKGFRGVIDRLGFKLTWLEGRELGSVQSTVSRHIGWMDSPAAEDSISKSTFDPCDLWKGKMTIYISLPHDKLITMAPIMRLWLGTILRQVANNGASEKNPVLFFCDEAAHLGKLRPLEDAITLLRGFGIRIWLFFQSLEQLKRCYGDKAVEILDNIGTQQYFAINSLETATHLSKRIGDGTILTESYNSNVSRSRPTGGMASGEGGSFSTSDGVTHNEAGRPLIRPEEILVLPKNRALVFHENLPVIPATLAHYYDAPEFSNGGTGEGRRLGLPTLITAGCALLVSFAFAGLLARLPSPDTLRRAAFPRSSGTVHRPMARGARPDPTEAYSLEWSLDPFLDPQLRQPVPRRAAHVRPTIRPSNRPPLGWRGSPRAQRQSPPADDLFNFYSDPLR
jgi:type IV secretion system protein VirD4